ncbi:tyrosine-protein phosphatase [Rubrimonas cliftonensis]|uniref:Putative phosphatase n=1 Tax=Rubrimonas cliftonensis TaxID=89524 RepID=A0A1H3VIK5_9RHOB|nr:tyrosine-protein phosphatase [Rubrimonas cliftonensis]SDZ74633.1 Putative phosphatase [Rubrimonas cliftonensis]
MTDAARQRRAQRVARRRRRYQSPFPNGWARFRAHLNAWFVDHQVFRAVYPNLWRLGPHAWRSSQPSPAQLRRLAKRGLRTVVNLRGGSEFGSYALEREACADLGLAYRELKLFSRHAPEREAIAEAAKLFDEIAYPALLHCKSGADRAGLAAALYVLLREGGTLAEAKAQLAPVYGHFRMAKTGVLDATLDAFGAAEAEAAARGETLDFLKWSQTDYDPAAVTRGFRESNLFGFIVDRVLRRE